MSAVKLTHRKPCPVCDKGPKDRALAITANQRGIMWYCHRCKWNGAHRWEYLLQAERDREDIEIKLSISIDVAGRRASVR